MLLAIAFVLFAVMLVSWIVAPSTEKATKPAIEAPIAPTAGAALQH